MCGILGVIYGPGGPEAEQWTPSESAELMFPNIVHRGKDAWGWMHLKGDEKSIQLRKFAEPATEGLDKLNPQHRFGIPNDARWWIGHVRLATHGTNQYTHNNHPIVHGDIMGVHNGICYNYSRVLAQTGRQHKKAEVDSEAIFAAIHKYGIASGLDVVDALAAIAFVDRQEPNVVYLATADANPCVVAKSKGGAIYFASESWILEELNVEWDEAPWMLDDYTLVTIVDGVQESYVYWADKEEKQKKGYGKYVYPGTRNVSSYGGEVYEPMGTGRYGRHDLSYDDYHGSYRRSYDPETGRMESVPLGKGTGSGSTLDEHDPDCSSCVKCGWAGYAFETEGGICPSCGSDQWLIPIDTPEQEALSEQLHEQLRFDRTTNTEQNWLGEFVKRLNSKQDENATMWEDDARVVLSNGRILSRVSYDNYCEAIDKLGRGVNPIETVDNRR